MGLIKVTVWSAACIGLGIFLATHSIEGRTAVQHAEKALNGKVKVPPLDQMKGDVADAIDSAKKKLVAPEPEPTEKHSVEDKEAVNRLIARRKP